MKPLQEYANKAKGFVLEYKAPIVTILVALLIISVLAKPLFYVILGAGIGIGVHTLSKRFKVSVEEKEDWVNSSDKKD